MLSLILAGVASAAVSLEKPWKLDDWKASGDYLAGNDVFLMGSQPAAAASLWTERQVPWSEWTFDIVLRAFPGSADPGNSGFAFFYTSEILGEGALHGSSEYYDGLAVTVDSMGWDDQNQFSDEDKGAVRGHLSDGTAPFTSTPADQSFSLCRMPYRSANGPINLRIGYGRGVFIVEVNKQKCFSSDKIVLPAGFFGISANTGTSDDTFALDRVTLSPGLSPELEAYFDSSKLSAPAQKWDAEARQVDAPAVAAAAAGSGQTVTIQPVLDAVKALGDRLDAVQIHLDGTQKNIKDALSLADSSSPGLENIVDLVETINHIAGRVESMDDRLNKLTNAIDAQRDTISGFHSKVDRLSNSVDSHSKTLPESVNAMMPSTPSFWGPVVVLLFGQAAVYIGYMSYIARQTKHQKLL